jgi:hypothetical protein
VFSADGLKDFGDYRWERALLTKGDYLLDRGINRSFLDNGDRDANWRRLLRGSFRSDPAAEQKRQYVSELLDEIDVGDGVKKSLDAVLAKPLPAEPWRRATIEQPEIVGYCWGRKARWHGDGNIYLLRKIRMSAEYAELFTYFLKAGLLTKKHQNGRLTPFGAPQYYSVSREAETPYAYLEWKRAADTIALKFINDQDSYRIEMMNRGGQLPPDLRDELVNDAGFQVHEDGTVSRVAAKAAIESTIDGIVKLAQHCQPLKVNGLDQPHAPQSNES